MAAAGGMKTNASNFATSRNGSCASRNTPMNCSTDLDKLEWLAGEGQDHAA